MQIHEDGMDQWDLLATYWYSARAVLRGGRLTDKEKRALARRRDAAHARADGTDT